MFYIEEFPRIQPGFKPHAARQGSDALARARRKQEGGLRPVQEAAHALRRLHGVRGHPGVSRHRHQQGAEPAPRALEAHRRPRPLHPALRHRDQVGLLRRRSAPGRRAQSREAHVRGDLPRRRRARHDRGLARGRAQAPRVRMAEGIDVLDPDERLAPHRQRDLRRRAAAGRHHRAQRAQHDQQRRGGVRQPVRVPRPLQRGRRLLQAQGRHRARSGARPRDAAHELHPRRGQLRPAAR